MKKTIITYSAMAIIISGCSGNQIQDINTGLSTINSGLSVLSGKPLTPRNPAHQNTTQYNNEATITPTQESKLMASLNQNTNDENIKRAITEATPVISAYTKMHSCVTKDVATELNQFAAPGKAYLQFRGSPVVNMKYHDKSTCATVLRTNGWKMPARNALQFETTYISDSSGETATYNHEIAKQPNGEWLFNN